MAYSVYRVAMLLATAVVLALGGSLRPAYAQPAPGLVLAFAPDRIVVIDPTNARVIGEISPGTRGVDWGDAVATADGRLVFANDASNSQVVVVDPQRQAVVDRLDVGQRPVHIYNPLGGNEIWTHSDGEGAFYVVNTQTLAVTGPVAASATGTGHGKLLYDADLGMKGYATNVNDAMVHIIDLAGKRSTGTISTCQGTHGKAYSSVSKHAYFECGRSHETAIVDTVTDTLVRTVPGNGQLFTSPDQRYVLEALKADNLVRVFDAAADSAIVAEIPVSGGPDHIFFHQHGGKAFAFTANTQSPDSAVIDLETMSVTARIYTGDIKRPEGASTLHRGGDVGGRFFVTPASADGIVAIVDAEGLTLHDTVPVADVDGVVYVGPHEH